jgi:hypothetical protein
MGCEYCATLLRTCCVTINSSMPSASVVSPRFVSRIRLMVPWSSTDTRAAQGSCDPDIAADQAHLQVPIELVDFGGGGCRWFDNNQGNLRSFCCCCCCWSVALGLVGSSAIVSFTPTWSVYIAVKPGVGSQIPGPAISEYWIVEF